MKTPASRRKEPEPEEEKNSGFRKVKDAQNLYEYIPNGKYYAFVKFGGKKKRYCLGVHDEATARRSLGDFIRNLEKLDASQRTLTLRDLCARYLTTIKDQAKSTVSLKKAIIERLLEDFQPGGDIRISKIKPSDLRAWIAGYKFGYSTHNHYVQVLKALFEVAVADKAMTESPVHNLEGKKIVKPIRLSPTFEEFKSIVANVRNQRFNAEAEASGDFLEFMGLIGVGQAEMAGLQRQHVNLKTKQITFFRAKTRTPFVVPIFPQAEALVTKLVNKPGMAQADYVFPVNLDKTHHTQGASTRDGKKALAAACKRLKLSAYTQRSFRRMFITRCIEKGIDVKVIAQWQGHQDGGKLILGTYSHVRNTHAEEMAKLLTV